VVAQARTTQRLDRLVLPILVVVAAQVVFQVRAGLVALVVPVL
jgi:hypothetical protein